MFTLKQLQKNDKMMGIVLDQLDNAAAEAKEIRAKFARDIEKMGFAEAMKWHKDDMYVADTIMALRKEWIEFLAQTQDVTSVTLQEELKNTIEKIQWKAINEYEDAKMYKAVTRYDAQKLIAFVNYVDNGLN